MTRTPFFLNVDGPSGTGKGTLIEILVRLLKQSEPRMRIFKFAENQSVGLDRELVIKAGHENGDFGMVQEIIRQRLDVFDRLVNPFLMEGRFVIADRWLPSTLAYQTLSSDLSMENVWDMHQAADVLIPPLVVITRCSLDTVIEREAARAATGHIETGLSGRMTSSYEKREKLHTQYGLVAEFLKSKGVEVLEVNTEVPESLLFNASRIMYKIADIVTPNVEG